jgi:hypothetical protein
MATRIARAAVYGTGAIYRELVMDSLVSTAAGPVAQCLHQRGRLKSTPFPWLVFGGDRDLEVAQDIRHSANDLLHINQ